MLAFQFDVQQPDQTCGLFHSFKMFLLIVWAVGAVTHQRYRIGVVSIDVALQELTGNGSINVLHGPSARD